MQLLTYSFWLNLVLLFLLVFLWFGTPNLCSSIFSLLTIPFHFTLQSISIIFKEVYYSFVIFCLILLYQTDHKYLLWLPMSSILLAYLIPVLWSSVEVNFHQKFVEINFKKSISSSSTLMHLLCSGKPKFPMQLASGGRFVVFVVK